MNRLDACLRNACMLLCATMAESTPLRAQCNNRAEIIGRWDLTVTSPQRSYPSWLEVTLSGNCTLVGRFVSSAGSSRPISRVEYANGSLHFAIPPQWEGGNADLQLTGTFEADRLSGTITTPGNQQHPFVGVRAPALLPAMTMVRSDSMRLFNGRDLDGWTTWPQNATNNWRVVDGVLTNTKSGANLVTTKTFSDFSLHVEFRYPVNGNSGVYLRGRYEIQIEDTPHREWPEPIDLGGVYGFIAPNQIIPAKAGEWHSYDITLVGRRVTLVVDGRTVIPDQLIPGITGGALDSSEGEPGPILLQGDHTTIEFRNIRLTTLKARATKAR